VSVKIVDLLEERLKAAEARMYEVLSLSLYPTTSWHIPRFAYVQESRLRRKLQALRHEVAWRVRHAWDALVRGRCENGDES
jgi:hypothetical protein